MIFEQKSIDHEYTEEIVCPYCGYEERDSWEAPDEDDDYMCDDCGESFYMRRDVDVTYVSQKHDDDDSAL